MVAYSFQEQFVGPIRARTKRQTIRGPRKRHARPGEEMQICRGLRTKHCFLIGLATCELVEPVRLDVERGLIKIGESTFGPMPDDAREIQARCDGFANWEEMQAFWRKHHPTTPVFTGVLIRWKDFCDA